MVFRNFRNRLPGCRGSLWDYTYTLEITLTVATEIKVKLIPREYFVAFAFAMILIGQMILRIQVHIETSPRI